MDKRYDFNPHRRRLLSLHENIPSRDPAEAAVIAEAERIVFSSRFARRAARKALRAERRRVPAAPEAARLLRLLTVAAAVSPAVGAIVTLWVIVLFG